MLLFGRVWVLAVHPTPCFGSSRPRTVVRRWRWLSATPSPRSLSLLGVSTTSPACAVAISAGLEPGEIVVTAGVQALRPGQVVRLPENGA